MRIAKRVPVLMYHRLGMPDGRRDIYCTLPDRFSTHMHALAGTGHNAIGIETFLEWQLGKQDLPEKSLLITFDDGFMGVHDHALPVLRSLGWPATVFLVAAKTGQQSDWRVTSDYPMRPHPLMGLKQLLTLHRLGISLQSHSLYHHDLTTLDPDALDRDLVRSRELIAEIAGHPPRYLAYPYGRYNNIVRAAAVSAGFSMAFTVDSGFNSPRQDPYRIHRIDIFGSDSPSMLLRKIALGTNDGSLGHLARYYVRRLTQKA